MKRAILAFVFLCLCLSFCACGEPASKNNAAPGEDRIMEDLKGQLFQYSFEITDVSIDRSQTNENEKTFFADITFTGENEYASFDGTTRMNYILYDQGWMLDRLNNTHISYTVTAFQSDEDVIRSVVAGGVLPLNDVCCCGDDFFAEYPNWEEDLSTVDQFDWITYETYDNMEFVTVAYEDDFTYDNISWYTTLTISLAFDGNSWVPVYTEREYSDYCFNCVGEYWDNSSTGSCQILYLEDMDENYITFYYIPTDTTIVAENTTGEITIDPYQDDYIFAEYKPVDASGYLRFHIKHDIYGDDMVYIYMYVGSFSGHVDDHCAYPDHIEYWYRG